MITGTAKQLIVRLLSVEDSDKVFEIREHRKKRTLSQNSYYWLLAGKVAQKLHMTTAEVHNRLLRDYGQLEVIDGSAVRTPLPDTPEAEQRILDMTTVHLKPTSQVAVGNDGVTYRTYVLMRGSSTYNTVEMTRLLDGCIQEAKQQGIETLTPVQLAQIRRDEAEVEARQKARRERDTQKDKGVCDTDGGERKSVRA